MGSGWRGWQPGVLGMLVLLLFVLDGCAGTAAYLRAYGLDVDVVYKVNEGRPNIADEIVNRKVDLVINTPQGSGARADGYLIREAALVARVPCVTTISGAAAAVHAIANARAESALSLQERIGIEA